MNLIISGIYGLALLTTLISNSISAIEGQKISGIISIQSLAEIEVLQPENTLFLLDLDDTIFDFPYMVGSRGWRRYIAQAAPKIDNSRNWHDRIFYFLTKNYPVTTVEHLTSEFIKYLQSKEYVVCGYTARARKLWYDAPQEGVDAMTTDQLKSMDINFNNNSLENIYPYFALNSEYFSGIFFCNYEPKGNFLTLLFKDAPELPLKVVFIDDKLSQVESVAGALTALGVSHESYWYLATNAKVETFNPLIANIQLYHFCKSREILSDDEAALIAKDNPDYNEDFYLRAVLEIAEDF